MNWLDITTFPFIRDKSPSQGEFVFMLWSNWIETKQYVSKDLCYLPKKTMTTYSQIRPQVSTFSNMPFLPFGHHIEKQEDPIVHTNNKIKKGQVDQCYGTCVDIDWISRKQWILPTPSLNVQWQKLISPHVRKTKRVLDSGFHSLDSGFLASGTWILDSTLWIPDSLVVEPGFRIAIVSGIPDSFSWIPHSKAKNSGLLYKAIDTLRKL